MRLPAVARMLARIKTSRVRRALAYLISIRDVLAQYSGLEDLVFSGTLETDPRLRGFDANFGEVRAHLAKELWRGQRYIGVSVLDSLLFEALSHGASTDPVRLVLEKIRDLGLHGPGFVLYPVHSVGMIGAGLLQWATRATPTFAVPSFGLVLRPQTNNFERTLSFIDDAATFLGIRRRAPRDLLEHWRRSRPTEWLELNPLLLARINTYPGGYYENQSFLILRLRLATSLILMGNALQPDLPSRDGTGHFGSSRHVNNFQTLDISHYFVFYANLRSRNELTGQCVPMNVQPRLLSELSAIPAELDPRYWRRRPRIVDGIATALDSLSALFGAHAFARSRNTVGWRVSRKLINALTFFHRSYRGSHDQADEIINLAIAFEVLLTDSYAPGIDVRLMRRSSKAMGDASGKRKMLEAIQDLHHARNQCVHSGTITTVPDLRLARKAFVLSFVGLAKRLGSLPRESGSPISDILDDSGR